MNSIVVAIVSVTVIGVVCSVLLAVLSKIMAVEVDERLVFIRECLPGANCGACGYSGCNGYAAALAEGSAAANLCTPGGNELVMQISEFLGVSAGEGIKKKVAIVRCIGDSETKSDKMDYRGTRTCAAAKLLFGGPRACTFGCVGYGDCVKSCPSDAICLEKGIAHINQRRCTGCGLCAKACPYGVISIEDAPLVVVVLCKNTEKGAALKDKCSKGCIGCMKCVKECPSQAITVNDFLASIDYEKCIGCLKCTDVCIKKCIKRSGKTE